MQLAFEELYYSKYKGVMVMDKIYRTMDSAGKYNLVTGICLVVSSIATCVCGAFMIVHAGRLLQQKNKL